MKEKKLELYKIGESIYNKVMAALNAVDEKDREIYRDAIFVLPDGRRLSVGMLKNPPLGPEVELEYSRYSKKYEKYIGQSYKFWDYPDGTRYCRVIIHKPTFDIKVNLAKEGECDPGDLLEAEAEIIEEYLSELDKLADDIKYDEEEVHVVNNLLWELDLKRGINIYKEEVANLPKGETVLPVIKIAVDWWISNMRERNGKLIDLTKPLPEDVQEFRTQLINLLTDKLEKGRGGVLNNQEYLCGTLRDAYDNAHVKGYYLPAHTCMDYSIEKLVVIHDGGSETTIYEKQYEINKYLESEPTLELEQ